MSALGYDIHGIAHARDEMKEAGFENIAGWIFNCHIGTWMSDPGLYKCGELFRTVLSDGLVGLSRKPLGQGLGWTNSQIEMHLTEVRDALWNDKFHVHLPFHATYGQKVQKPVV